jgi:hypothetical protein
VAQRVGADTSSPGTAHRYPQTRQRGACPLRSLLAAPIIRYLTVFDCEEYSTFLSFVNSVCIRKSQESCALRNTLHCVDEGSQSSRICGPLPFRALTKRALRGTRRNQQGLVLSTRLARPSRQFSGSHTLIEMRAQVWLLPPVGRRCNQTKHISARPSLRPLWCQWSRYPSAHSWRQTAMR